MAATLKLFFHDACFDGTASAALFAAFYRDRVAPGARIVAVGMIHRDGDPFSEAVFDGDDHACVDFRFCAAPQMRWWFDHHRTAFQPPALRTVFEADAGDTKFFDPDAPSCAGMIGRILPNRFGWEIPAHLADLPSCADLIDAARFASADEAVALTTPGQQLALWISRNRDPEAAARYIDLLSREGMAAVARASWLAEAVSHLERDREASRSMLCEVATTAGDGEVVTFDLLDVPGAANPGFLGYQLYPRALYTIALVRGDRAIKISVGVNPWCGRPRTHDIGALCEAQGGGGHAVVGGITLDLHETERARAAAAAIASTLAS